MSGMAGLDFTSTSCLSPSLSALPKLEGFLCSPGTLSSGSVRGLDLDVVVWVVEGMLVSASGRENEPSMIEFCSNLADFFGGFMEGTKVEYDLSSAKVILLGIGIIGFDFTSTASSFCSSVLALHKLEGPLCPSCTFSCGSPKEVFVVGGLDRGVMIEVIGNVLLSASDVESEPSLIAFFNNFTNSSFSLSLAALPKLDNDPSMIAFCNSFTNFSSCPLPALFKLCPPRRIGTLD